MHSGIVDQKEGLYFGEEIQSDPRPLHGPNIFPDDSDLRPIVLEYMAALTKVPRVGCLLIAISYTHV